jgi:chitin synthase
LQNFIASVELVFFLQEFFCVLYGFLYFLAIPSMSMLLTVYSLGNLHVVSWGTRETKATEPQQTAKVANKETDKTKSQMILESLGFGTNDKKSDHLFSCGNFIRYSKL